MTIKEFDTAKGIFVFEFGNFETEFHSHPAMEIIIAIQGTFTLHTEKVVYEDLTFAVVDANQKHKLSAHNCKLTMIMIEHHNRFVKEYLKSKNISLTNGFQLQTKLKAPGKTIDPLVELLKAGSPAAEYDKRVSLAIHYLNENDTVFNVGMKELQQLTHLSESRISHLFKANTGISLKKYLIWAKLKSTLKRYLTSQDDLLTALVNNGFYDQPHFSKSFKNMLGISPSKAYPSRIVQIFLKSL